MKRLFLLLALLISTLSFSQVDFNPPKQTLSIDDRLVPYVEDYISEGRKRGFYLRSFLIERVDYILVADSMTSSKPGEKIGGVGADMRGLYVSSKILSDTIQTKVTIYHELGHIIKQNGKHVCYNCYNIMSEYAPIDLSPYKDEEFWEKILDIYFHNMNTPD